MVKISSRDDIGLSPKRFELSKTIMEIDKFSDVNDCVKTFDKVSKDGKTKYEDYTLKLVGKSGDWIGEYEVNFLFQRDLKELADAWGEDSIKWIGKRITLSARKEGKYLRWIITPILEQPLVTEERISITN